MLTEQPRTTKVQLCEDHEGCHLLCVDLQAVIIATPPPMSCHRYRSAGDLGAAVPKMRSSVCATVIQQEFERGVCAHSGITMDMGPPLSPLHRYSCLRGRGELLATRCRQTFDTEFIWNYVQVQASRCTDLGWGENVSEASRRKCHGQQRLDALVQAVHLAQLAEVAEVRLHQDILTFILMCVFLCRWLVSRVQHPAPQLRHCMKTSSIHSAPADGVFQVPQ